jgi:hypothetical protein
MLEQASKSCLTSLFSHFNVGGTFTSSQGGESTKDRFSDLAMIEAKQLDHSTDMCTVLQGSIRVIFLTFGVRTVKLVGEEKTRCPSLDHKQAINRMYMIFE